MDFFFIHRFLICGRKRLCWDSNTILSDWNSCQIVAQRYRNNRLGSIGAAELGRNPNTLPNTLQMCVAVEKWDVFSLDSRRFNRNNACHPYIHVRTDRCCDLLGSNWRFFTIFFNEGTVSWTSTCTRSHTYYPPYGQKVKDKLLG